MLTSHIGDDAQVISEQVATNATTANKLHFSVADSHDPARRPSSLCARILALALVLLLLLIVESMPGRAR